MIHSKSLRVWQLIVLLCGLSLSLGCDRKSRPDKVVAPALSAELPSGWTLDADWSGSSLKMKELSY